MDLLALSIFLLGFVFLSGCLIADIIMAIGGFVQCLERIVPPIALIRKLHTLKSSLNISDSVCYEAAPTRELYIYIYTHNI